MKKTFLLYILLLINFALKTNAQAGFHFLDKNKKRESFNFKLINNLIVIPLEVNGKKLSFILDSGVSKTILFNITKNDSLGLNDVKKVKLQGLGKGEPVEALFSRNNRVTLGNLVNKNEVVYVILEDHFDLSGKMGITIHGIVGYSLFKNFVVKINYKSKKIIFYKKHSFKYKKCRKCEVFPLQFYRKKPFIDVQVQLDTIGKQLTNVKLLIDSGGSDTIWLFENTKENIKTPNRFFSDVLGEGLSGSIYGNRSRMPKIKLKSFEIINPTVSFLDTISTKNARVYKERNGSIGAEILNRFIVWFDYPNRRITLKKNGSFKKGFNYNMSGLDVVYDGKQLIREEKILNYKDSYNQKLNSKNSISFISSFSYKFKPFFKIKNVLLNSPGYKAGLLKDDIILKINRKPAYDFTLGEINQKFQEKDGRKIRMLIERKGERLKFEFRLVKKI